MKGNYGPTPFDDLNELLAELVERATEALAPDLIGVYLVGSFALGSATAHSDVDFMAVTGTPPDADAEDRLRAMHRELFERPTHWAQELEGSYAPSQELRWLQAAPSPWLYIDNGSRELMRSTHFNTAIVRRTLHRHGIALYGPRPSEVVENVDDADLVAESRRLMIEYRDWLADDEARLNDAWRQPYIVATFCRMLTTIATGDVVSKRVALEWALRNVDDEWRPLIEQALEAQPVPFSDYGKLARPASVDATRGFISYAVGSKVARA